MYTDRLQSRSFIPRTGIPHQDAVPTACRVAEAAATRVTMRAGNRLQAYNIGNKFLFDINTHFCSIIRVRMAKTRTISHV